MTRIAIFLAGLALVAVAAESLTLTFADGKRKSLTLVACDEQALTVSSAGEERRIPWAELAPESAYAARKTLTPYDDGESRLVLSEFAARLRLFPEALEQLEIALALGGVDEGGFERRARDVERKEVAHLCTTIDTLLMQGGEPAACLRAIKRLRERYPEHPRNALYEPHVDELVGILAEQAIGEQEAAEAAERNAELESLRKAIEKIDARKTAALERAEQLWAESRPAIEKGQVSRIRRKLVEPSGAELHFKQARSLLRAMAQLDDRFRIVSREALQAEYDRIEQRLIACYLEVARMLLGQRNYKGAVEYVRKILYYDPIHEEALEMVEQIRKNRISFKASELTNTHPRVTSR